MFSEFDDSLSMLIDRSSRLMKQSFNRALKANGLNVTLDQGSVLLALWVQNGLNQQQLAEKTQKSKVSIVKLIDGLERKKLVMRLNDPKDRRTNLIFLTNKGESLKEKLNFHIQNNLEQAVQGIGEDDLVTCISVLNKIIDNMK